MKLMDEWRWLVRLTIESKMEMFITGITEMARDRKSRVVLIAMLSAASVVGRIVMAPIPVCSLRQ